MIKSLTVMLALLLFMPVAAFNVYSADSTPVSLTAADVVRTSPAELKNAIDKGETILIVDVRSSKAYNNQHIKGAMTVPLNQVETVLGSLPSSTKIVFY